MRRARSEDARRAARPSRCASRAGCGSRRSH